MSNRCTNPRPAVSLLSSHPVLGIRPQYHLPHSNTNTTYFSLIHPKIKKNYGFCLSKTFCGKSALITVTNFRDKRALIIKIVNMGCQKGIFVKNTQKKLTCFWCRAVVKVTVYIIYISTHYVLLRYYSVTLKNLVETNSLICLQN